MRYIPQIAELALECSSLNEFQREYIESTRRALGASGGAFVTMRASCDWVVACDFDEPRSLAAAMKRFADEVTPDERARGPMNRSHHLGASFSAARRDELHLFREYNKSVGARPTLARDWLDGGVFHSWSFVAPRLGNSASFADRACALLDETFPIVAVAMRLLTQQRKPDDDETLPRGLTLALRLTDAEHATMALVMRGLTNPEIAQVLGISANTVRNRLAACFPKIGASRRAEAVYLLEESKREQTLPREGAHVGAVVGVRSAGRGSRALNVRA